MGVQSPSKPPRTPYHLFDGLRVLSQLYILLFHYLAYYFIEIVDSGQEVPPPIVYVLSLLVRIVFVVFFLISGVCTCRWFLGQLARGHHSNRKLVLKFYFERITMILPFYYAFLAFYYGFLRLTCDDKHVRNFVTALAPNLLFISNFYSTEVITLVWNWTYSVLLQLVLITPLFIFCFKRSVKLGIFAVIMINIYFILHNFYLFFYNGFTNQMAMNDFLPDRNCLYSSQGVALSYYVTIHVKPFLHGPAYFNGLLVGYLLERGHVTRIGRDSVLVEVFANVDRITKMLLSVIILLCLGRGIVHGDLPFLSALESSLFSSLFSYVFAYFLLTRIDHRTRHVLSLHVWRPLRRCLRVSYLIHPVVFMVVTRHFPVTHLSVLGALLHLSCCFIINYLVAMLVHEHVEKRVMGASERISVWLFQ